MAPESTQSSSASASSSSSPSPLYETVSTDLRGSVRGQWGGVADTIVADPNQTIFISDDKGAGRAKGSLVQSMRQRGKRLRSRKTEYQGKSGIIFWAEDKTTA